MIDVLVVDDDFRVAEINAKYVGKVPGFRVAARAHSAAQALASVQRGSIDLVLLDHYLPDQTGLDLVHRMREQGHGTDVIMITARCAPPRPRRHRACPAATRSRRATSYAAYCTTQTTRSPPTRSPSRPA